MKIYKKLAEKFGFCILNKGELNEILEKEMPDKTEKQTISIDEFILKVNSKEQLHDYNLLKKYSIKEGERYALETKTMVLYYGEEVALVQKSEEQAALQAMPPGYDIQELNGLNVGCGSRTINPFLCQIDAHRGKFIVGDASYESYPQLMAFSDKLPFADNTIDFILALHILEHEDDPVSVLLDWLRIIKPGGGIGLILPDYRYTWDGRNDDNVWGHRWSPTPEVFIEMFETHLAKYCTLEKLQTYPYKISFDAVLRKHGKFIPFNANQINKKPTGKKLGKISEGKLYPGPKK